MKRSFCVIAMLGLLASLCILAHAQEPPEATTRGAFLITRKKPTPPAPAAKQPKQTKEETRTSTVSSAMVEQAGKIGLGYTLYRQNGKGNAERVTGRTEFSSGEKLRLVVETNANCYLYVFNTSNGQEPSMIFPNVRLDNGDNHIKAHVPTEIPSSKETNPGRRWFVFTEKGTIEQLYILITRQPLPDVPTGEKLLAEAPVNESSWVWEPEENLWRRIIGEQPETLIAQGQARGTDAYPDGVIARKIALPPDAPEPSVIKVSKSAQAGRLLTIVELKVN